MQPSKTVPEVLQGRAERTPEYRAYVFLDEGEHETAVLTYGDLHARAVAVASCLARHCTPGDRAVLLFPPGLDFIVAFFGCLYAQVIAVPLTPPRRNRTQEATLSILRDCEPAAVLTVQAMLPKVKAPTEGVCGPLAWLVVDELQDEGAESFAPAPARPDSLAFLQYTSGSTSAPKGVMVSHGNLVANQEMIRSSFDHDERSTVVGWAPLFHDQGLIGNVLQPLYVGATSILMSPSAFIRWPMLWLSAISRYRAHTSGGPNFAFDACVARAAAGSVPELDLSCWKVAFNGAEPIQPGTLARFAQTFAAHGFSEKALFPCYGLAEATLIVTGSGKGRGPRTLEVDGAALASKRYEAPGNGAGQFLVSSGRVPAGGEVLIVDAETRRPCPPREAGEIWVRGDHVAHGYWRNDDATRYTFRAECSGSPGSGYLRTGDLGLLLEGELYVIGRLQDLIIIRGRNYYPQDIECTVQSAHHALKAGGCAAFSVPGNDGERIVVVQEIRREEEHSANPAEVASSIRAAVLQEHEVSLSDLVLTRWGRLQKTSSGKIMRTAARKRYLDGGFDRWPADPASD